MTGGGRVQNKRITVLCGHYGSGKSNIAVNMALEMKKRYDKVTLADLDIVNPYFRSVDSRAELEQAGIRVIASDFVNTNLDVPALPSEIYSLCDERDYRVVIDLGGDDRGALALGRLRNKILAENDFDSFFVLNCYRPLTRTPQEAVEVICEVEAASGLPVTGLVNNSNLGAETNGETVLASVQFAEEVSKLTGLPIVLTSVDETLTDELNGIIPALLPLRLQKRAV